MTIGVTLAALGVTLLQTPIYSASAQILMQPSQGATTTPDSGTTVRAADADRLIQTQVAVIESDSVQSKVQQKLGPDTPDISVSQVPQTNLIEISAESTNKQTAVTTVDTYAQVYLDQRKTEDVGGLLSALKEVQARTDDIQGQLAQVDNQIAAAPVDQQDAAKARFGPEQSELQKRLSDLNTQLDQLKVQAALATGGAQLVAPAKLPTSPVKPSKGRSAVFGAAAGLLAGLALALLIEYLDDSIKDRNDLVRHVPGLPILATIPLPRRHRKRLVTFDAPGSPAAEAFRSLRTIIMAGAKPNGLAPAVMLVAPKDDGASATAANLATVIGETGRRVVLVDADVRRPTLPTELATEDGPGLAGVLSGDGNVAGAVRTIDGRPELRVLPSGPTGNGAGDLLARAPTAAVMTSVRSEADSVILYTAPVLAYTDASLLAPLCDSVIVVVTARKTSRRDLREAVERLNRLKANILGAVFVTKRA